VCHNKKLIFYLYVIYQTYNTNTIYHHIRMSKVAKKDKKKDISESDSYSYSDSESYQSSEKVPKKVAKKTVSKKVAIKEKETEYNGDFESIDKFLQKQKYEELKKTIPKYKNITSMDVNKIIQSNPTKKTGNGYYDTYNTQLVEEILEEIIKTGYEMNEDNYLCFIKELMNYGNCHFKKISSPIVLKNFYISDESILKFAGLIKKRLIVFPIDYRSLDKTDIIKYEKNIENFLIVMCAIDNFQFIYTIEEINFPITEKFLPYAKSTSIKKYIREHIVKNLSKPIKINKNENDDEFLNCYSIDEVDEFIDNTNYEITSNTIILACQYNKNIELLKHLLSYKINFDENSVNEIIKSYRNNENIETLLLLISQYGYIFQKSNYREMLASEYFYNLFRGNIILNFTFDDDILNCAYDAYKPFETNENFMKFLENIESLGYKDKKNAENIIALYCGIGDEQKIKKLCKDYNVKLTPLCLKFLYKNKSNVTKKSIELFKKDNVKPDYDVLKQYIDTFSQRREQVYLYELF
jgi:hypothetical protein